MKFFARSKVPQWAAFMSDSEYRAFMALVRAELGPRLLSREADPDGRVRVEARDSGFDGSTSLGNLAVICRETPRTEWAVAIGDWFKRLLAAPELPASYEDAKGQICVRLIPEAFDIPSGWAVERHLAHGLRAALVVDDEQSLSFVNREAATAWGVDDDTLFDLGYENVRTHNRPPVTRLETTPITYSALEDNPYVATWMLMLDSLTPDMPPHGALVVAPTRSQLLWVPITDRSVTRAFSGLLTFASDGFAQGPWPVSPGLYWWRASSLTPVYAHLTGKTVNFYGPQGLLDLISQLPESA